MTWISEVQEGGELVIDGMQVGKGGGRGKIMLK